MRYRKQNLKKDERGAAMIIVMCILAVFFALSLSLLLASSTLVSVARNGVTGSRCKIEAVTFSDRVGEDLADETSELNAYVKQKITGGWAAHTEKEFEQSKADGGSAADCTLNLKMQWHEPERPVSGAFSYNDSRLIVTVTVSRGKESHRLKSEYVLNCSAVSGSEENGEEIWKWTLTARG